jgi:DNA-binding response OmpR family regulator
VTQLLVIDDEVRFARALAISLRAHGYEVEVATTGEEGLSLAAQVHPDVVILDLGLPGMDGLEVCRRVRAGSSLPIIMLTARDEEVDRVAGLELGADDYVPKPFSPRELAARVKAVLRRSTAAPRADELELADVTLSRARRDVSVAGAPIALSATEFNLLAFLMENPGIVFSREVLLDRVWGIEFPGGTRTVDQHVAQVRAKLARPDLIETVRGAGYRAARS